MLRELFIMCHCVDVANSQKGSDLSHIAVTYIVIVARFVLGGLITCWIYNRQKTTAVSQQEILDHVGDLEEKHRHRYILEKHEFIYLIKDTYFEQNQYKMLKSILPSGKKKVSLFENK